MMTQFVEVNDLSNYTFLLNVNDILFIKQVIGRSNQLELTLKVPDGLLKLLIQANYSTFMKRYRLDGL
ncbi:MAG: hypothetical protein ABJG68_07520 [Crocinitomicaceae bacterium]